LSCQGYLAICSKFLPLANQVAEALAYLQQTRQQMNAYKDQLDNLEQ